MVLFLWSKVLSKCVGKETKVIGSCSSISKVSIGTQDQPLDLLAELPSIQNKEIQGNEVKNSWATVISVGSLAISGINGMPDKGKVTIQGFRS